jgi:CBS domain containing-hemolysin-like protein/mannitol/fructose-specific phosphotransferase system IIA component (Ntr-type)
MIGVLILVAVLLLLLNGFFVLAEFAAVKVRPSRIEELVGQGNVKARMVRHVQQRLDEYLSVCQVGITFASIGLGFTGEPVFAELLGPALERVGLEHRSHEAAIGLSYVLVSFLHILLGELVPKSIAIRKPEGSALVTAIPLRIFYFIFYVPLVLLNGTANLILRLLRLPPRAREQGHTEDELRIILGSSQSVGLMSFRRLLLLENVFDLGEVRVRDAMRPRESVKVLRPGRAWEENFRTIRDTRLSRFPLVEDAAALPLGVIHVKDLLFEGPEKMAAADLRKLARPLHTASEDAPLENLLTDLMHGRGQMAIVLDREGRWSGVITFEDVIEEIIGTVEDEFEVEPPITLRDAITPGRIVLGIRAADLPDAITQALSRVAPGELPAPSGKIIQAVLDRERAMSTYLGQGLAIPHARLESISRPALIFSRSEEGVPISGQTERAHLLFILLTPSGAPRDQVRLLARIVGMMDSEYVVNRLRAAPTPEAVVEAIRAADPIALS